METLILQGVPKKIGICVQGLFQGVKHQKIKKSVFFHFLIWGHLTPKNDPLNTNPTFFETPCISIYCSALFSSGVYENINGIFQKFHCARLGQKFKNKTFNYLQKLIDNVKSVAKQCKGKQGHIFEPPAQVLIKENSPGIDVANGEKIRNIRVVIVESSGAEFWKYQTFS